MDKPLSIAIKETREKVANICNESGLPPVILDLIMQGIYYEIHSIAERQSAEEEKKYMSANIREEKNSHETQ